jgi:subtilisin family serine protease
MFSARQQIRAYNAGAFSSSASVIALAQQRLLAAGFEIRQVTPLTINISGTPDVFEKAFRTKIVEKELSLPSGATSTYLDSPDTETLGLISTVGTSLGDVLEGVALEVPRIYLAASPTAPTVQYWHLDVPADVAVGCNAAVAHGMGITGRGVRVAMVDSGWFRHPYFTAHLYDVDPVVLAPGATEPDRDESGHGTGESANILAIAPNCKFMPVKANFVNTIAAFNAAVALRPDVISCSWGSHSPFALSAADMALAASISAAVASGIVVVFSAGNGHAGFPGQHPDVISAGGVFLHPDDSIEASDYSSAFTSLIYPGRFVPDVCGLVGMRPKAIYIMLPVEPADAIDTDNSGSIFPDGDETAPDDAWAAFSGTSAAAPQLAGSVALIKQVAPFLAPADVKNVLMSAARDVTEGFCSPVGDIHSGLPAGLGPDAATGSGLVDAYGAVASAWAVSAGGLATLTSLNREVAAYYQGIADTCSILTGGSHSPAKTAYLQAISNAATAVVSMC